MTAALWQGRPIKASGRKPGDCGNGLPDGTASPGPAQLACGMELGRGGLWLGEPPVANDYRQSLPTPGWE